MISFKKPFTIQLSNDEISIKNSHDIDITLSGRINPSPGKVIKLLKSSPSSLDSLEKANKKMEFTIHEMLVLGEKDTVTLLSKLQSLDIKKIIKDNQWKSIISSFIKNREIPSQAIRLALLKYTEYLKNIDLLIDFVRSSASVKADNKKIKNKTRSFHKNAHHKGYIQLPKNHPVSIIFPENENINILLGNHSFVLIINRKWNFFSPDGNKHSINIGRNTIGRSKKNDICLGKNLNDISRVHLIIERVNKNTANVMDTSSLGTCLPSYLF